MLRLHAWVNPLVTSDLPCQPAARQQDPWAVGADQAQPLEIALMQDCHLLPVGPIGPMVAMVSDHPPCCMLPGSQASGQ
jgi:hypothetical protein